MKKIIIYGIIIIISFILGYMVYDYYCSYNKYKIEKIYALYKRPNIKNNYAVESNYFDLTQYKDLTLGDLINIISHKLPLVNIVTSYPDKNKIMSEFNSSPGRHFVNYVFYLDSNTLITFNVYLPIKLDPIIFKLAKDKKDIYEFVENQKEYYIFQLKVDYKKYILRYLIDLIPEEVLPGPKQDPFYRKIDSLKAVLKR